LQNAHVTAMFSMHIVAHKYIIICQLIYFANCNCQHCTLNSSSWLRHHRSKAWSNNTWDGIL